jgi:hypothetical protein
MSVEHIEFNVEEPSMEAFLGGLVPRMIPDVSFSVHVFQGKDDMLSKLPSRLKGYARWLPQTWRVVVLLDRDDDDCLTLKKRLETCATAAGLGTRTRPGDSCFAVVNRIAIEELEAWYFGDWRAVCSVYERVPPTISAKARYRDSDAIQGGTWEAFERVLQRAGYFKMGLRKVEAAREIGLHIDPDRNTSHSFQVFRDAVIEMTLP